MESLLISTGVVALAEIGDKTQLLAMVLAARFRKPVPIVLGILAATLLNHAAAGAVGVLVANLLDASFMRWALGISFLAMAIWMLIPDRHEEREGLAGARLGVFAATLIAFFLVEIGDKTQIATVALAAKYYVLTTVVIGTTLGMMLANVPIVLLGDFASKKLNMRFVHGAAAVVFTALGVLALVGVGGA